MTRIARSFCEVIRKHLTPDEIKEAIVRNRAQTDPNVCHTHDFCDANMAMEEAVENSGLKTPCDIGNGNKGWEECCEAWGLAWDKAKEAEFVAERVK